MVLQSKELHCLRTALCESIRNQAKSELTGMCMMHVFQGLFFFLILNLAIDLRLIIFTASGVLFSIPEKIISDCDFTCDSSTEPLQLKLLHLVHKASPFLSNEVGLGDAHIFKVNLSSV